MMERNAKKQKTESVGAQVTCASETLFPYFSEFIEPFNLNEFLEKYWEKQVLHVPRDKKYGENLFTVDTLFQLVKENNDPVKGIKFSYGVHLNVTRCVNGSKQEMHNKYDENGSIVQEQDLKKLWNGEKCTVQFFQPQRYLDSLWKMMHNFENEFDCLWGANVYLTPSDSQGLAPHYDDVEVFVLQTQGEKEWTIYESIETTDKLAMEPSLPLPKDRIGKVAKKVILSVGDMLYLPRGTIHSARASGDQPSVHVTFSTYQRHSMYDFMSVTANRLIDAVAPFDINFRVGVPIAYRGINGQTGSNKEPKIEQLRRQIANALRSLASALDMSESQPGETVINEVSTEINLALEKSLDEFTIDFMKNRLPPLSSTVSSEKEGTDENQILLTDKISIVNPCLIHYFAIDTDDVDMKECDDIEFENDDANADDSNNKHREQILRIYHCIDNSRTKHMGGGETANNEEGTGDISISAEPLHLKFLGKLVSAYPGFVKIPSEELLEFVNILHECKIVHKQ